MADYWSDKTVFARIGGLEVAAVIYEVQADFAKPLPQAFALTITLRAMGMFLGNTTMNPIADGNISIAISQPIGGNLAGNIQNWAATDAQGNPVPATDATWSSAAMVSFIVTALGNVTLPIAALLKMVPGLGFALKLAAGMLGSNITVNIGHKTVALPIHRDANGKPVQPA